MNTTKYTIVLVIVGMINFLWFPSWMILKTFYDYDLTFMPIFGIDVLLVWYMILSGKLEGD